MNRRVNLGGKLKLLINKVTFSVQKGDYEDGDGHILQFLADGDSDASAMQSHMASQIAKQLSADKKRGVMCNAEHTERPADEPIQVRVLCGLELPLLMELMANGFAVEQVG